MQDRFTYAQGARLPGVELGPWTDRDGDVIDLTAYTCTCVLEPHTGGANITPTATVSGSALGFVTITWGASDLATLDGLYNIRVRATEIATSKPRDYSPQAWPLLQVNA